MRIRCLITRSFLRRYVDNDVGARLKERIQGHLDECEACRERVRSVMIELPLLRPDDVPQVSEAEWQELWGSVLTRVEDEDGELGRVDSPPFSHSHTHARYALLAAAVALLVAGAVIRLALAGGGPGQTPITSYIQYHEAAVDGHVLLENHFFSAQVLPVSYTASK